MFSHAFEPSLVRPLVAEQVSNKIKATNRCPFHSDISITGGGFADQIDVALNSAIAFVLVGSRAEHLHKSWVKYEWRQFQNDVNSNRKPADAPFFAFVIGINEHDLPRPLRLQPAITADPTNLNPALDKLAQVIAKQ